MRETDRVGNMPVAHLPVTRPWFEMLKLYSFIGATAGGSAGWALGSPAGIMTAFVLSIVGTAVGIYAGRRVAHYYGG